MAEAAKDKLEAGQFRCKLCGAVAAAFRDWQRCWPCSLASGSRDTKTLPGICEACHREKHRNVALYGH